MTTALAPYEAQTAVIQHSQEEFDALKASVCKDLTPAEFTVFVAGALARGLDPFTNQIYAWKQGTGDKAKVVTMIGIDGARSQAESTGLYRGRVGPFWCGADGVWTRKWLDEKPPVAAKVGVKRAGFDEIVWGFARFRSYTKGEGLWVKMPEVMIAKCAEMTALRAGFPKVLGGVYIPEEMRGADLNDFDTVVTEVSEIEYGTATTAQKAATAPVRSTGAKTAGKTQAAAQPQRSVSKEWQRCYDVSKAMGWVKSWADWDKAVHTHTTPAVMQAALERKINESAANRQRYRAWKAAHPEPVKVEPVAVASDPEPVAAEPEQDPIDVEEAEAGWYDPEDPEASEPVEPAPEAEAEAEATEVHDDKVPLAWYKLNAKQRTDLQTLAAQAKIKTERLYKIVTEYDGNYTSIKQSLQAMSGRVPAEAGAE